jgi:putative oxidoreductase
MAEGAVGMFDNAMERYSSYVLSILRIVAALLFFEHGTSRLFGFPSPLPTPQVFSLYWFAGSIELVGGALLLVGLFSRPVALIMSGEMAFAYFLSHAPHGFFPILNRGDGAILYCFIFFYIAFAGPGPVSLDALRRRKAAPQARERPAPMRGVTSSR